MADALSRYTIDTYKLELTTTDCPLSYVRRQVAENLEFAFCIEIPWPFILRANMERICWEPYPPQHFSPWSLVCSEKWLWQDQWKATSAIYKIPIHFLLTFTTRRFSSVCCHVVTVSSPKRVAADNIARALKGPLKAGSSRAAVPYYQTSTTTE